MINQDELLKILEKRYSTDNKGDYMHVTTAMTAGIVVDTDDPLQQGRLRVFCPSHGDNPEKIHLLPWCVYVSPFGGVIDSNNFERGGQTSTGAIAYGMWAIPDLGADVLVGCIDGDLRRRYYIGCIYDPQYTHTLFNGRYDWSEGGNVNGPLSSMDQPIQPLYDNKKQAFGNKTNSPEYQSRVGEYTATAVDKSISQVPNPSGTIALDQSQEDIAACQQFSFNVPYVGGHGYDFSGFSHIPFKSSRVFGFTTPGFHSITMDDRPNNMKIKIRSSSGHMITLDDTNDRIYMSTAKGNNYIEMDGSGNIDIYAARRLSLHSDSDINLDAGGSIRMTAKQGIYGYAGDENGLPNLGSNPSAGEIRFQSQHDMHIISDNYRQLSFANTIFEIGGDRCESVGGNYSLQVQFDMNTITNSGDYNLTVSGDFNLNVLKSIKEFAIEGLSLTTKGDVNMYAFYGSMNLAAQQNIVQKAISGNITIQAVGANSAGTGAVNIKAPSSQIGVSNTGTSISTTGTMSMQSGGDMSVQANSPPSQDQPPLPEDQVPNPQCDIPTPVPIAGFTGADLAARVAYNAGFRGQSLVMAVAISGAESRFNPNATGDVGLENAKWGPSLGFWQIRTLKSPSSFSYPDTLRDANVLYDPQTNANAAYVFSKQGLNFGPWSTYTSKAYLNSDNIQPAIDAINRMCGVVTPTPSTPALVGSDHLSIQSIQSIELPLFKASPLKPSIRFTDTSVIIQSIDDISFVSMGLGESIDMFASVKDTSDRSVTAINELIATVDGCCNSTMTPISPMAPTGVTLPVTQIPSNYFPYVDGTSETLMNLANFDINGKTIIT